MHKRRPAIVLMDFWPVHQFLVATRTPAYSSVHFKCSSCETNCLSHEHFAHHLDFCSYDLVGLYRYEQQQLYLLFAFLAH